MNVRDAYAGEPPHQSHSETSVEAAEEIKPYLGFLQSIVLTALKNLSSTDEELVFITKMEANTLRPRRRELELKGLIRDSGVRRKTRSGRRAVVWEVAK